MAEMIDKETLFRFAGDQKVKETGMYTKGQNKAWNTIRSMCHSKDGFPTVNAEPVAHAHWEEVQDDYCGDTHYRCTFCGEEWTFIDGTPEDNNCNYCPRCGAKMGDGDT